MDERLIDDPAVADLADQLRSIEESLRDLAYDRLRQEVEAGAERASRIQRRLEQARRAVAKAVAALDPSGE